VSESYRTAKEKWCVRPKHFGRDYDESNKPSADEIRLLAPCSECKLASCAVHGRGDADNPLTTID